MLFAIIPANVCLHHPRVFTFFIASNSRKATLVEGDCVSINNIDFAQSPRPPPPPPPTRSRTTLSSQLPSASSCKYHEAGKWLKAARENVKISCPTNKRVEAEMDVIQWCVIQFRPEIKQWSCFRRCRIPKKKALHPLFASATFCTLSTSFFGEMEWH